ncbi:MAG: MFS transporter, partial [Thermoleophilaceae bacterium]|nr:MFS transporter [Thermoleophilaceae bacterium]
AGAGAAAAAPGIATFYLAQVIVGLGVACLLSAGFAGVGAWFSDEEAGKAMGYVVGAQSLAWIAGNPVIGLLTEAVSWRLAYAVPGVAALTALLVAVLIAPRQHTPDASGSGGLGAVLRDLSARRWAVAELVAYAAWTAELTYAGAFYIESYDVSVATVGFLLAAGSLCFLAGTLVTDRVSQVAGRKRMIVFSAAAMGVMLALILNLTPSVAFTVGLFCVLAVFAAFRSTGTSALGLHQLPERSGSMMAARTTSAQLGYMLGALAGGAIIALSGFGLLGFALLAGMLVSAALLARVHDPHAETTERGPRLPEAVPD